MIVTECRSLAGELELCAVTATTFAMGSSEDEIDRCVTEWRDRLVDPAYTEEKLRAWIGKEWPRHRVTLAPYAIGRVPITNALYREFTRGTGAAPPRSFASGGDDHPVWGASLADVERFVAWLGARTGRPLRLPTEAEWEYAARGADGRQYPFGEVFDARKCNTVESGIGHTTPVRAYTEYASPLGVADLAGNVEEWTSDDYAPYPGGAPITDDLVEALGPRYRVCRGGSFQLGGDLARGARRHGPYPSARFETIGFRVALSLGDH